VTKFACAGLFAFLSCGPIHILSAQSIAESPANPFQISVDFNLVVLPATVHDRKGGFASDLQQENFEVFEDGVKQAIRLFRHEDIPVTVGLVVDHSGSMHPKIADVLLGARMLVQLSNPEDEIFVVNFNERVNLGLPSARPFTDRVGELQEAIMKDPIAGQTALYDAVGAALDRLQTGDREKKVLIVISDGGDNASRSTLAQVLKKAEASSAVIYTIGIFDRDDPDQNVPVLRRLAKESGGEAFFPEKFEETIGICKEIASDIRHQYTLGYVSTSNRTGGHRSVRVVAKAPGRDLTVRTRTGYLAASPAAAGSGE
jgi:VWFA-related protein